MEKWSVSLSQVSRHYYLTFPILPPSLISESDLDDVLQISNVFVNVSKGEVAKAGDLKKSFGTDNVQTVVKEVRIPLALCPPHILISISRFSTRVTFKSERKSENTISRLFAVRLRPLSPRNVSIPQHRPHTLLASSRRL